MSGPSEKAESLAKKLGVTYCPKTNADRMGGQFKKDLDNAVTYLKSLPKPQRWCFMAGLKPAPTLSARMGWNMIVSQKGDARPSVDAWRSNSSLVDRLGRELVFSKLPDEVKKLRTNYEKRMKELKK